jgi:hypothetical protein
MVYGARGKEVGDGNGTAVGSEVDEAGTRVVGTDSVTTAVASGSVAVGSGTVTMTAVVGETSGATAVVVSSARHAASNRASRRASRTGIAVFVA